MGVDIEKLNSEGVKDRNETVQDRLPRDIDERRLEMSLKDEYPEYKALEENLKNSQTGTHNK